MDILVVVPNRTIGQIIQRVLQETGQGQVALVATAEQATRLLKTTSFGLIVTDANLPGVSGLDLVKALRASRPYRQTPVIMISNHNGPNDVMTALAAGADEYLLKPLRYDVLVEKVIRLKERAGVTSQAC